jgi:hypothetical protein
VTLRQREPAEAPRAARNAVDKVGIFDLIIRATREAGTAAGRGSLRGD